MGGSFRPGLTVGEVVRALSAFSDDMPVVVLFDARSAGGSVTTIEIGPGPDDPSESAVLIVE